MAGGWLAQACLYQWMMWSRHCRSARDRLPSARSGQKWPKRPRVLFGLGPRRVASSNHNFSGVMRDRRQKPNGIALLCGAQQGTSLARSRPHPPESDASAAPCSVRVEVLRPRGLRLGPSRRLRAPRVQQLRLCPVLRRGLGQPDDQVRVTDQGMRRSRAAS